MRVVLDTNVLARAIVGPNGPAAEVLLYCSMPPHVLIVSPFILSELARVLGYDRLRRLHGLPDAAIDQYVRDIQAMSLVVLPPSELVPVVLGDANDDPVIQTAVAGGANALCTRDQHLLEPGVREYCRRLRIEVLNDIELLHRLRKE
jgi:putative PIN family toxin of toxin-antitoxin system